MREVLFSFLVVQNLSTELFVVDILGDAVVVYDGAFGHLEAE